MIVKNVNPNKLHDELINVGIVPLLVTHDLIDGEITAENTEIIFADGVDMVAVQAVIDVHNPEPLPNLPTTEERLKQAEDTILYLLIGGI